DAKDIQRMAASGDDKVMVGYCLRFHPAIVAMKRWLEEGKIGRLHSMSVSVGSFLPDWRKDEDHRTSYSADPARGGGVLLDLSHEIDYALWFLGDDVPRSVAAFTSNQGGLGIKSEEQADLVIKTRDGALVTIHMDYLQRPPSRSCELRGSQGTIVWDARRGFLELASQQGGVVLSKMGFDDKNRMYLDEMKHFLSCVKDGTSPLVGVYEGVRVLDIVAAARRSAEQGLVVGLPQ
ncbi:MAG: Gfo/Idh/MocA family oxidoreductase, partial [Nanoarchaeota archaeon]